MPYKDKDVKKTKDNARYHAKKNQNRTDSVAGNLENPVIQGGTNRTIQMGGGAQIHHHHNYAALPRPVQPPPSANECPTLSHARRWSLSALPQGQTGMTAPFAYSFGAAPLGPPFSGRTAPIVNPSGEAYPFPQGEAALNSDHGIVNPSGGVFSVPQGGAALKSDHGIVNPSGGVFPLLQGEEALKSDHGVSVSDEVPIPHAHGVKMIEGCFFIEKDVDYFEQMSSSTLVLQPFGSISVVMIDAMHIPHGSVCEDVVSNPFSLLVCFPCGSRLLCRFKRQEDKPIVHHAITQGVPSVFPGRRHVPPILKVAATRATPNSNVCLTVKLIPGLTTKPAPSFISAKSLGIGNKRLPAVEMPVDQAGYLNHQILYQLAELKNGMALSFKMNKIVCRPEAIVKLVPSFYYLARKAIGTPGLDIELYHTFGIGRGKWPVAGEADCLNLNIQQLEKLWTTSFKKLLKDAVATDAIKYLGPLGIVLYCFAEAPIQRLDLGSNPFGSLVPAAHFVGKLLGPTVQSLSLYDGGWSPETSELLVHLWVGTTVSHMEKGPKTTNLHHLNLSRNTLGDGGAKSIASLIQCSPSLQSLQVGYCRVPEAGTLALIKSLPSTLQFLNMSSCGFGYITSNELMEELDAYDDGLSGHTGTQENCDTGNDDTSSEAAEQIEAEEIETAFNLFLRRSASNLVGLWLDSCSLNTAAVLKVMKEAFVTVKYLDLSGNDTAVSDLIDYLKSNSSKKLESLAIDYWEFENFNHLLGFLKELPGKTKLQAFSMQGVTIDDIEYEIDFEAIFDVLGRIGLAHVEMGGMEGLPDENPKEYMDLQGIVVPSFISFESKNSQNDGYNPLGQFRLNSVPTIPSFETTSPQDVNPNGPTSTATNIKVVSESGPPATVAVPPLSVTEGPPKMSMKQDATKRALGMLLGCLSEELRGEVFENLAGDPIELMMQECFNSSKNDWAFNANGRVIGALLECRIKNSLLDKATSIGLGLPANKKKAKKDIAECIFNHVVHNN